MTPKTAYYVALAEEAAKQITGSREQWTAFLTTAARLYKYPFNEQLMIYKQRPEATACAEYDLWNETMRRYVKRGSKGIALIDTSGDVVRLRYVFDVADTGARRNSRPVNLWKMQDEYIPAVKERLGQAFDIITTDEMRLVDAIDEIAGRLADEYWDDHRAQILDIVDDSFLYGYDEFNVRVSFRNAAEASIKYMLMSRCVEDVGSYFEPEDFMDVFDFNTQAAANVLGTAVSEVSGRVFREIERAIRTYERGRAAERSQDGRADLHEERGLPDSQHRAGGDYEQTAGQIRENAPGVPSGEQHAPVQSSDSDRKAVPASAGDSGRGGEPDGADDGGTAESEPRAGQEDPAARLGTAHEFPESTGRGSDTGGAYQQLSFIFPSEAEQISYIDTVEQAEAQNASAFSMPLEEVYEAFYPVMREHLLADEAYRNACANSDPATARMEGEAAVQRAALTIQDADFMRMYFDNPVYADRLRDALIEDTLGELIPAAVPEAQAVIEEDDFSDIDPAAIRARLAQRDNSAVDAMLEQAVQMAEESAVEPYERFRVIEVEGGLAVWDDIREEALASEDGNTRIFLTADEADVCREQAKQAADEQTARDWLYVERAKNEVEPPKEVYSYAVGDTVYLDGAAFEVERIGLFDVSLRDLSAIYPISRAENKQRFEAMLWSDERNAAYLPASAQAGRETEAAPTITSETVGYYPGDRNGLPFDVVIQKLRVGEPEKEEPVPVPASNFRITDNHLGEGGPKTKFRANMDAIHTLQRLEAEGRNATPEEQEILSKFVGWGGLADAFDESKPGWANEYRELRAALTEEEYTAARASTLNAHYTSPTVIRAIYDALAQMGFEKGNILEPSMGVGNFFGMLPDSMQGSKLYGVELDSITGRIARKLYPNADITVAGFETTDRRDFYDLAVGNVPFGNYRVTDKPYDKLGFNIHNYFFAKALDQVRPGGIVAFVTSRFTMDSKSTDVRKYLAQRAELLGAIRLPNNAFMANAGTGVVSDIIFLQKRDLPIDIEPDWVHLGLTSDNIPVNSYFTDHPEMVLGRLSTENTQYGRSDVTVEPIPGAVLADQLKEAVAHIHGSYEAVELAADELLDVKDTIPADPNVKNFSFAVMDGEVYFRENSIMRHMDLNATAKERVTGMVELRRIVGELIDYQLEDYPDEAIRQKQAELNSAYDAFYEKYGTINSRANAQAFAEDSSYYLLCSLENIDEDGRLESKAEMFTRRTIRPERTITSVDTPSEALAVSIGEHGGVDLHYMAELLGTPGEFGEIIEELQGVIFRDPLEVSTEDLTKGWHTADDYLSGNVRAKLTAARLVAASDPSYAANVSALERAQPKDLDASEIDVRLGATWIDPRYIQQFMEETFEPPYYMRHRIQVQFSPLTAEWQISGKSMPNTHDVAAYTTFGTLRANAYRILEDTLNLRDVRIYDTVEDADGKQKRVLNKKETTLAQQKQQAIKDAFRDWVWRDPRRRETLVQKYNELFNSTRPREYDGSHIRFGGMNPDITLREHQRGAIAHVLYGGNTLLAHEVGAGKTFEMAASAMEAKRLGLCQKSMFVVPNHLTMQWANEFLRLYPSAKILVATKKDFETARRKKFCARIATGNYDAVIIGHSQFEKIPISPERQERLLRAQIEEIEEGIEEAKRMRGENFTIKQMEKTRKSLQARLDKLLSTDRKDDVITFEQLGVDRLYVDEAHAFKNLFLFTKMRNVAGLSTSEAQKSSDMFMKCRYMDEITGGRGVIFATGTPVSNSMTELYTMMRYLQYGTLQQKCLSHFDCWASTFGETTTAIELAPEGTGYRARTRFAKFFNLPELMNMFKEAADIKTADQLHLPVPEAVFKTVVVQPSEHQKAMVAELSERAAAVHSGKVEPSQDNMLKITSDGRKLGLDQRLMNPLLPDDPDSKLNACVWNVLRIWEEGKADKLTQLLFCDLSTPKGDGTFNVYEDIRDKLLAAGVPQEEIAFIHDADTEARKKELFAKVRSGQVRILLGSTQKMGAGTNVQDRLIAVHHLDVGWRPADMTQRNGRIIRQGNRNPQVQVYQYVTEGTFDAYLYQTLENKQKFISQIMTSKSPVRSCDDVDEQALSYAEIKALCAGNPLIKEKMDLDIEVARLKVLRADYQSQHFRLEDQLLKYFPAEIEKQHGFIRGYEADMQTVAEHPVVKDGFVGMEIGGVHFTEKDLAGEAILAACQQHKGDVSQPLGSYRGFAMELSFDSFSKEFQLTLKGALSHRVTLGTDAKGNLLRIDNVLGNIPQRLGEAQDRLSTLMTQQEAAKAELEKPFPQEAELAEKSARLAELDALLSMDEAPAARDEEALEEESLSESRPSVLADLKSRSAQVTPPDAHDGKAHKEEVL